MMRELAVVNIYVLAGIAILSYFIVPPVMAANLNATPSVTITESWDSNIFNVSNNEESDFILRVQPTMTFSLAVLHATLTFGGSFELEDYAEHNELDETAAGKNFGLNVSDPIPVTPSFSFLPALRFQETNNSVRKKLIAEPATHDISPTEIVVTARAKERIYLASLGLEYLLSPRTGLSLRGIATKREFPDREIGLIDSKTYKGDASIAYRISPRFSSGVFFGTGYNSFDDRSNSRLYTGGLQGTYELAQHYTVRARVGATYFKESSEIEGQEEGWRGRHSESLSINYVLRNFRATLLGSYQLTGISSFGRTTETGTIELSLTDQFADRWWWDFTTIFQTNRSIDTEVSEDLVSTNAVGGIRYAPVQWASINLSGEIGRQRSHGVVGEDVRRESVMLRVNLSNSYPLW